MRQRIRFALLSIAASALASPAIVGATTPDPAACTARAFHFTPPAGWEVAPVGGLANGREACSLTLALDETNAAGAMRVDSYPETPELASAGDPAAVLFERFRTAFVAQGAFEVEREPKWRNEHLRIAPASAVDRASMRVYSGRRIEPSIPIDLAFVTLHAPGRYYTVFFISPKQEDQPDVWDANQSALRDLLNSFVAAPTE